MEKGVGEGLGRGWGGVGEGLGRAWLAILKDSCLKKTFPLGTDTLPT